MCAITYPTGQTHTPIIIQWFGGAYARRSYGYPWMLRYIADRYENVFSNQDLTRYVQEVPRFHNVIGNYVHCNRYIGDLEEFLRSFLVWNVFLWEFLVHQ